MNRYRVMTEYNGRQVECIIYADRPVDAMRIAEETGVIVLWVE